MKEEEVKRYLMAIERDYKKIPPINQYLRTGKNSFSNFLETCVGFSIKS